MISKSTTNLSPRYHISLRKLIRPRTNSEKNDDSLDDYDMELSNY